MLRWLLKALRRDEAQGGALGPVGESPLAGRPEFNFAAHLFILAHVDAIFRQTRGAKIQPAVAHEKHRDGHDLARFAHGNTLVVLPVK